MRCYHNTVYRRGTFRARIYFSPCHPFTYFPL
jgi:hypothetical protein